MPDKRQEDTHPRQPFKLHPATGILASFLSLIALGTALLLSPAATRGGSIPVMDALFTSTSAVCVTGLAVRDTGSFFTPFGQAVILALIQLGGLGVMTISVVLFRWIGRAVSFKQRMMVQGTFAHTPRKDIYRLLMRVLAFTAAAEAAGALLLFVRWAGDFPPGQALWSAVFHSVSAFCNAGFSLYADGLVRWSDDILVNTAVCLLIVIGGLGFPVLYELWDKFMGKEDQKRFSVQARTVLWTTAILIAAGALMFGLLERQAVLAHTSALHRVLASVFQSVTCRTAGFNTVDVGALSDATLALMIFLMFVGASPGSCGGGVKTTTLALLAAFTVSRIAQKRRVNLFRKSIPQETVTRSLSLLLLSGGIIAFVLFMILVGGASFQGSRTFLAVLFETVSAFGTVGLSMGITPDLGDWGKAWIILTMIVGRVGVLTFAYIVVGAGTPRGVEFSEENIMIG